MASALTNDWSQVILAVPGMAYNLLLRRSVDFDEFFPQVEANYPDELDQALVLDLLEQLWQRGENAGYAQHLTRDPYPGVKAKQVMLLEAFGDHQVANVSTEKLARTLQIDAGRPPWPRAGPPMWSRSGASIPSSCRRRDQAWSCGTSGRQRRRWRTCRTGQARTRTGSCPTCPRRSPLVLAFVTEGTLTDVCGDGPCQAPG